MAGVCYQNAGSQAIPLEAHVNFGGAVEPYGDVVHTMLCKVVCQEAMWMRVMDGMTAGGAK